jgi:two-component system, OmpR family, response regulator
MARLLVVEDEERIRRLVERALIGQDFEVDVATSGPEGLGLAIARSYDLVILDLMLPGMGGVDVLAQLLQHRPEQRVLVLSALPDIQTRVRVLEMGASDFLVKPFAVAELLARVRVRLRSLPSAEAPSLDVGDLRLDLSRQTLVSQDRNIPLSQREFRLLAHLMQRVGQVCSREDLLADVWGYGFDPGSNVVDVYVGRLRSKLDNQRIETVRNVGYCLLAS